MAGQHGLHAIQGRAAAIAARPASTGRRGELQKLCAVQMIDVRIPTTAAQAASAVPV